MNDLQFGKIYLVKEFFWFLFPTKKLAGCEGMSGTEGTSASSRARAYRNAKWYSEQYNCNVCVVEKNTCFVLLEQDKDLFKVLDSNGNIGWIRCYDFFRYFELVKDLE